MTVDFARLLEGKILSIAAVCRCGVHACLLLPECMGLAATGPAFRYR
jgi:hypothetical protein